MIAEEPRGSLPAIYEVVGAARHVVESEKEYGGSSSMLAMGIRQLGRALDRLENERRDPPPPPPRMVWSMERVLWTGFVAVCSAIVVVLVVVGLSALFEWVGLL